MSSDQGFTEEEVESLLKTAVVAAVVAAVLYFVFFIPKQQDRAAAPQRQPQQRQQQRNLAPDQRPGANQQENLRRNLADQDDDEDGIQHFLKKIYSYPSHHIMSSTPSKADTASHRSVFGGIISFRDTKASIFESNGYEIAEEERPDYIQSNRRARARIMAKIFKKSDPPAKGKSVVLCIDSSEVQKLEPGCESALPKTLNLLGTYYNLFIMLQCDGEEGEGDYVKDKEQTESLVQKLYVDIENSDSLSKDVIPPHRVVVTKSEASRVAFVRQLMPDLVIGESNDEELLVQLTKFGHKVILKSISELY